MPCSRDAGVPSGYSQPPGNHKTRRGLEKEAVDVDLFYKKTGIEEKGDSERIGCRGPSDGGAWACTLWKENDGEEGWGLKT